MLAEKKRAHGTTVGAQTGDEKLDEAESSKVDLAHRETAMV